MIRVQPRIFNEGINKINIFYIIDVIILELDLDRYCEFFYDSTDEKGDYIRGELEDLIND